MTGLPNQAKDLFQIKLKEIYIQQTQSMTLLCCFNKNTQIHLQPHDTFIAKNAKTADASDISYLITH